MADQPWNGVDEYLCDLLLEPDPSLDAALQASRDEGLPPIAVAPNQGKLLNLLVRSIGARSVLEFGTLGGYSTIWMARALPADGRVITLEAVEKHAEVAQANLERAGVAESIEIRLGAALESLKQLIDEGAGPFDFVFIDADKENTRPYFEGALKLSRVGTLIFVDNLVRNGNIIDADSTDSQVVGMREFMDYVKNEKRVDITGVQTVGSKGYDGFALAYVTEAG
jgi:predicted O-methyltransferase YrrM